MVITIVEHGFTTSDSIRIENNSLTFTCSRDSNDSVHTYPRTYDPYSGRWLRITAVTTDTFTVNVGAGATADQKTNTICTDNGR